MAPARYHRAYDGKALRSGLGRLLLVVLLLVVLLLLILLFLVLVAHALLRLALDRSVGFFDGCLRGLILYNRDRWLLLDFLVGCVAHWVAPFGRLKAIAYAGCRRREEWL